MPKRIEKVNELIREVVADIILKNIQPPDGTMVTVTRVVTSKDIHYTNIFITIFSGKKNVAESAFFMIRRNTPAIQRELNKKLRMRPVPKITFLIDEEEHKRERIEKILADERNDNGRP